jgi:hypothetical protein
MRTQVQWQGATTVKGHIRRFFRLTRLCLLHLLKEQCRHFLNQTLHHLHLAVVLSYHQRYQTVPLESLRPFILLSQHLDGGIAGLATKATAVTPP